MAAVVNVAMPVFGIILAGWLAGRYRLLGPEATTALNRFVYFFALPPMLFLAMARVDAATILNGPFLLGYGGAFAIVFVLGWAVSAIVFGRATAENALAGMTGVFGNTGYMGIPLAVTAFGPKGAVPAAVATVVQTAVVVTAVVLAIELSQRRSGAGAVRALAGVARSLATNPLVLAPVAGLAAAFVGLPLAAPLETFLALMGAAAGPCALFALGLFLVGKPVRQGASEVGAMVLLKLAVMPMVAWGLAAYVWPVRDPMWFAVLVLMAALPPGANVFILAERYGTFVQRSSAAILVATVVSVVTVSALLAWFGV